MRFVKKFISVFICFTLVIAAFSSCSFNDNPFKKNPTVDLSVSRIGTPACEESLNRKKKSMALASDLGIEITEKLQVIETSSEVKLQTKEDIANRAVALLSLALYAESILAEDGYSVEEAKVFMEEIMGTYDVSRSFSPQELEFLQNDNPSEMDLIYCTWNYENVGVLLWVLGLYDELPFADQLVHVEYVTTKIQEYDNLNDIIAAAKPKSVKEILDHADLIYRLDWVCIDSAVNDTPIPANLEPEVIADRHKTLNWVIRQGESWDNIDISINA